VVKITSLKKRSSLGFAPIFLGVNYSRFLPFRRLHSTVKIGRIHVEMGKNFKNRGLPTKLGYLTALI